MGRAGRSRLPVDAGDRPGAAGTQAGADCGGPNPDNPGESVRAVARRGVLHGPPTGSLTWRWEDTDRSGVVGAPRPAAGADCARRIDAAGRRRTEGSFTVEHVLSTRGPAGRGLDGGVGLRHRRRCAANAATTAVRERATDRIPPVRRDSLACSGTGVRLAGAPAGAIFGMAFGARGTTTGCAPAGRD